MTTADRKTNVIALITLGLVVVSGVAYVKYNPEAAPPLTSQARAAPQASTVAPTTSNQNTDPATLATLEMRNFIGVIEEAKPRLENTFAALDGYATAMNNNAGSNKCGDTFYPYKRYVKSATAYIKAGDYKKATEDARTGISLYTNGLKVCEEIAYDQCKSISDAYGSGTINRAQRSILDKCVGYIMKGTYSTNRATN